MPGNQWATAAARLVDSWAAPQAGEAQLDGSFGRRHPGWEGQRRDNIGQEYGGGAWWWWWRRRGFLLGLCVA